MASYSDIRWMEEILHHPIYRIPQELQCIRDLEQWKISSIHGMDYSAVWQNFKDYKGTCSTSIRVPKAEIRSQRDHVFRV